MRTITKVVGIELSEDEVKLLQKFFGGVSKALVRDTVRDACEEEIDSITKLVTEIYKLNK